MRKQLELSLYDTKPVKEEIKVYRIGDLESLSATALHYGEGGGSSGFVGGSFGGIGKDNCEKYGIVGSSNFNVHLPESNAIDRMLKVSTPHELLIINKTQRIKGKSGIDYFNMDGSLAGRLFGLNKSELDYLED